MTRYARAGKGTHQRVAKDPTPWEELKHPSPQRQRAATTSADEGGLGTSKKINFTERKERFSKSKPEEITDPTTKDNNDKSQRSEKRRISKNSNVRGFGQSKSIKILGQFWVPVDDARRIKGLLQKLKSQGLPRKEILEVLKNDRRRAEKAAKRQRDKTCFQCRQFGHVLSDCPNLKKAIANPGLDDINGDSEMDGISEQGLVCFKCGSTEHTSRKCKRKGENFEFAKCFVCSGSGHIARQCPQNSRGIYPSGGACSECGSTTHLKKDCPDLVGAEGNSSNDEGDAVLPALSDPFSSTEYEPVFEVDSSQKDESEEQNAVIDNSKPNNQVKSNVVGGKKKQKKKRKRKNSETDEPTFEFNVHNNAGPSKKLFSLNSNPKKRKIVKF